MRFWRLCLVKLVRHHGALARRGPARVPAGRQDASLVSVPVPTVSRAVTSEIGDEGTCVAAVYLGWDASVQVVGSA